MLRNKVPKLETLAYLATIGSFVVYVWISFRPPVQVPERATSNTQQTTAAADPIKREAPAETVPPSRWWSLSAAQTLSLLGLIAAGGLHVIAAVVRVRGKKRQLLIFLHERAAENSTLVTNIAEAFRLIGWRSGDGQTNLHQHAVGVWIRGGTDEERELAVLCLKGIGIESRIDGSDDPPDTLQVIVGAPDPNVAMRLNAARREYENVVTQRDSLQAALGAAQNEHETLKGVLHAEANQARDQRDGFEQAWLTCKRQFALARLEALAERVALNGGKPSVTIRFAEYADFALVKALKKILDEHTKWPVTEERPTSPVIAPSDGLKVIFVLSKFEAFSPLASIFDEGRLVEGTVGIRRTERDDSSRIVIEVLPTVPTTQGA